MFCLPKEFLIKIKKAINDGKFDMEKFNTTSAIRREMLAEIVGKENAKEVNLLYEKKLLLKNQETAMYKFVEDVAGISAEAKLDLSAKIKQTYADKNRRLYEPKEGENFLNELASDIYSRKYKTEVSLSEAQDITELAQDMKVAKAKMKEDFTWKNKKDGIEYGASKVALDNYIGALKTEAIKSEFISPLKEKGVGDKLGAVVQDAKVSVNFIAENSRSLVASLDNSLWFRQGFRALMDPRFSKIWAKDFATSWKDIFTTMRGQIGKGATPKEMFLGKDAIKAGGLVKDSVLAEGYSRQNYLNGKYQGKAGEGKAGTKLDIGIREEEFLTSRPAQIPILGRFFKGSEVAYEVGAIRLRMDIADKVYKWAEKNGVDMKDNKIIGDLNEVVNGMTGRGSFGRGAGNIEKGVNKAFFSIKFFKSNLDFLTLHQGRLSTPATKLAATNLLNTVATTGLVLEMAKRLNPEDNKDIYNPTSTNFGKIRWGNMTFDMTHGAGSIVVAMSRILTQQSTSGTTGITKPLGEGFGSQTGMDVLWNFTENKFSPMFSVIKEVVKQETFDREKPTIKGEIGNLTIPIIVQNVDEFKNESVAKQVIAFIADGVGISTSAYYPTTSWAENTSDEMTQFKEKVGGDKFQEANDKYNEKYNEWFTDIKKNEEYLNLSDEDKQRVITKKKGEIKGFILRQYGFRKERVKPTKLPSF